MSASEPDQLLDYEQAARYLCVSTRYLRYLVDDGEISVYRFGRAVRFKLAHLDELRERYASDPGQPGHTSRASN